MDSIVPALDRDLCDLIFASGWTDDTARELTAIAKYVEFTAGEIVFHQGSENDRLYLVCSGRVALDMHVPARGPHRILTLARGELLAWSAILSPDQRMTSTATAIEPVRAIAINARQLRELCERQHDIGFHVMRWLATSLAHRLTATRLQLLDLFSHSAADILRFSNEGH